jgi:hypothetical protein
MSKNEMERDDTNLIKSQKAIWTIEKSKQMPSIGTHGYYYVLPQMGKIDMDREIIDIAVEMEIINRKGAWYTYQENKWNGLTSIELSEKQKEEIKKAIINGG